jgi:hypothetical protein
MLTCEQEAIQPSTQPAIQPSTQPAIQPSTQPAIQPSTQPAIQPSTQPAIQPSTQPAIQPDIQQSTQQDIQPSDDEIDTVFHDIMPAGAYQGRPSNNCLTDVQLLEAIHASVRIEEDELYSAFFDSL